jgi:hypothetical protein
MSCTSDPTAGERLGSRAHSILSHRAGTRAPIATLGVLTSLLALLGTANIAIAADLCPEVQSTLIPQSKFGTPTSRLARFELRRCDPGTADLLQVVAWSEGATKPSLVVDTDRSTIVELILSRDVLVLVTAGGPYNRLQVLQLRKGAPELVLDRHLKEVPVIETNSREVVVRFSTAGREEKHRFGTGRSQ